MMQNYLYSEILIDINTMSCTVLVNSNKIELTRHTSCYLVLDLFCVKSMGDVTKKQANLGK